MPRGLGAARVPRGVLRVPGVADRRARARAPTGGSTSIPLGDVVTDAALRHIAWFTVWQATLSTVLTLVVGLPGAYVLARCEFPGRRVVRALVTVPFVLPTVVVGSAFVALLGAGRTARRASASTRPCGAILIAHVFFNYAVVVRTVGGLWSHLDPRPEEAARMLGASRLRALPRGDAARAAARDRGRGRGRVPVHLHVVRRDPDPRRPAARATLETEIYRQTAQFLNLPLAAALTIVQLVADRAAARASPVGSRAASGVALRLRAAARDRATGRAPARRARVRSPPTSR